jgi:PKHD-type hydroxylase
MCDLLIKETDWDSARPGLVNKTPEGALDVIIRKTDVVWLPTMSVAESILRSAITLANVQARWNYRLNNIELVQMGRYKIGGHYDYHKDLDSPNSKNEQRKLSAVLFLSNPEDYEGGEFEFKDIKFDNPKFPRGSIIVFPSFLDHRVNPVISGERITAVSWANGPAFN